MVQTEVLPEEDLELSEPDGMAHWVRIKALIEGGVVVALCGKRWIPKDIATAGEKEMCPICKELGAMLEMME